MHVVIIGAGLAGVTTAWYLRQAGFEVSVLEQREGAALETSYANGGQISVSHPEPWANPMAPLTVLRWLGREDAPLKFRLRADPAQWHWGLLFLRECLPERTARNTAAIASLAALSLGELQALRAATGLDYDAQTRGILHLCFDSAQRAHAEAQARLLAQHGIPAAWLSPQACVELEPALAHLSQRLIGALHGSSDESGDAHRFVTGLAQRAAEHGVRFLYGHRVLQIERQGSRVCGLSWQRQDGQSGQLHADHIVLCAGSYSPQLARRLGERLPIYPVKGYSITVPVLDAARAPSVSITDEARRVVCSRLGDRLRVAGTAELNGYDLSANPAREAMLLEWLATRFPGAGDLTRAEPWRGLRPTTPSNLPLIGQSGVDGLWYNTGHGTLGWTLACGSAASLRELMLGRKPAASFPFLRSSD